MNNTIINSVNYNALSWIIMLWIRMWKQNLFPARSIGTKHTLKRFKTKMTFDIILDTCFNGIAKFTSWNGAMPKAILERSQIIRNNAFFVHRMNSIDLAIIYLKWDTPCYVSSFIIYIYLRLEVYALIIWKSTDASWYQLNPIINSLTKQDVCPTYSIK